MTARRTTRKMMVATLAIGFIVKVPLELTLSLVPPTMPRMKPMRLKRANPRKRRVGKGWRVVKSFLCFELVSCLDHLGRDLHSS